MGHAYEAVSADIIARYHRGYGREVFFLTGADEHGQKIADTAKDQVRGSVRASYMRRAGCDAAGMLRRRGHAA